MVNGFKVYFQNNEGYFEEPIECLAVEKVIESLRNQKREKNREKNDKSFYYDEYMIVKMVNGSDVCVNSGKLSDLSKESYDKLKEKLSINWKIIDGSVVNADVYKRTDER